MTPTTATRVTTRILLYYLVLILVGTAIWRLLPHAGALAPTSLDALFGGGPAAARSSGAQPLDEVTLAITVCVAMLAAVLLALPVAWTYLLTRAKRGYEQSVVQLLIILPLVVAGIVLLVKYSVTLAFSLAGVVAAVRFRNTLNDSKDAVYVFLATAVGLAAAVNLPVALVISFGFNAVALILWYTDFGSAPMELDGHIADKRLRRARQLARTGTFVAKIDDEVLQNMTKEQLEGIADRAIKRANASAKYQAAPSEDRHLRLVGPVAAELQAIVEPRLGDYTKTWRLYGITTHDGADVIEYVVQLRKRTPAEELISLLRASAGAKLTSAEFI